MKRVNLKRGGSVAASRATAAAAVVLAAASVVATSARAADVAYSVNAVDANFGGVNWTPGQDPTAAPTQAADVADSLYFGGTPTFTTLNNDLTGAAFTGLTFNSDAAAFTIGGNAFTLGGNLVNNSASTQTITPAITLDAVRTLSAASTSSVQFNPGTLVLSGSLSGPGGLIKTGAGTVTLRGSNSYAGTTTVSAGSLIAQRTTQVALGTGAVSVASGADLTITDHAGGGQLSYANNFTLTGSGTDGLGALKFFNSANFSVTGTTTISGGTTIGTDHNGQTTAINFTGAIGGSGGLTLVNYSGQTAGATTGQPYITLSAANNYAGDTRLTSNGKNVYPFSVRLQGTSDNRLPTTTNLIFGGTPTGAAGTFDQSVTLELNNTNQTVAGLSTANAAASGQAYRIVSINSVAKAFTVTNATANTFDGILGGTAANNNNFRLVKTGAGLLTLGGNSSFANGTTIGTTAADGAAILATSTNALGTGGVAISAGTGSGQLTPSLRLSGGITLPNAITPTLRNVASTNAEILNVSGNNILSGNIAVTATSGGNGFNFQSDAGTLTVNGNVSYANQSAYVFQGAGDFVVNGALNTVTTGGLTKSGAGKLKLNAANSFAGTATISGGTLTTGNAGALGTAAVVVTGTADLTVGDGTADTVGGLKGLTMNTGTTTLALAGIDSQVQLAGGLFKLDNVTVDLNGAFSNLAASTSFTIIDSVITNSGNTIGAYNIVGGNPAYTYTLAVVNSQDAVLNVVVPAPEPTTVLAAGVLGGLLALRRRRTA